MATRCVVPYIEKGWKKTANAARAEAERQAIEYSVEHGGPSKVRFTGRTFHGPNDWAFEFAYEISEQDAVV